MTNEDDREYVAEYERLWGFLAAPREEPPVPTVDQFLAPLKEQLRPEEDIEKEYRLSNDPSYAWKALRLITRTELSYLRSPAVNSHMKLPDILENRASGAEPAASNTSNEEDVPVTDVARDEAMLVQGVHVETRHDNALMDATESHAEHESEELEAGELTPNEITRNLEKQLDDMDIA